MTARRPALDTCGVSTSNSYTGNGGWGSLDGGGVVHAAQRGEHLGAQLLGSRLLAGALDRLRQHHADVGFALAVVAVGHVLAHVGGIICQQLVVQILLEFRFRLVAAAIGHFFTPLV